MCQSCDPNSGYTRIFFNEHRQEYYLDIETSEWDNYNDEFFHITEAISYCPWCGRKLKEEERTE